MRVKRSTFSRLLLSFSLSLTLGLSFGCKDSAPTTTGSASPGAEATKGPDAGTTNFAPQDTSGDTILVGHYASMTGEQSTFGTETDNGVKLAADEINAKGGILGKKIKIETQDDQSKPDEAKTVVTNFAANPKVVAVIGEVASTRSKNAAPVLQKAGIPMISPSSTNPEVTAIGDYIFRVCFIDPFQGAVMAKFATEDLKAKKVGVMKDPSSDYSVGLADVFKAEVEKKGVVVTAVSFNAKDSDFRSQLSQLKGMDAIFIPGYYDHVGTIAQQARELGITCPLLGGDGWDSPELVKGAGGPGKALEGCYFSNHYSKDDKSPRVLAFVKAYAAKYSGATPSGLAALGYDAMMVLAKGIEAAKSTERAKVKDAVAQTKDFPGVTGDITIDDKRNASKPAVVLQIKGDQFVYQKTIKPGA